ncbi:hypothetical protein Gorai_024283 [Gossypium raimondii]|uniref:Secreted protein n=1 Tax=Gossypium raimondii TaxID=29730 RepID=A0A7J8NZG0_GOSRA|nr:hypothetical protein [Gossypium raimondii]
MPLSLTFQLSLLLVSGSQPGSRLRFPPSRIPVVSPSQPLGSRPSPLLQKAILKHMIHRFNTIVTSRAIC